MGIERSGWGRLFPLTPALSPGERENRSQRLDKSGALEYGMRCDEFPIDRFPYSSPCGPTHYGVGRMERRLMLHKRTSSSSPALASRRPSGENARDEIALRCPRNVARDCPEATSQSFTV